MPEETYVFKMPPGGGTPLAAGVDLISAGMFWRAEEDESTVTPSSSKSPTSSDNDPVVVELRLAQSQFETDALSLRVTADQLVERLIAQKWVVRSARKEDASEQSTLRRTLLLGQLMSELRSLEQLSTRLYNLVFDALSSSSTLESLKSITTKATETSGE